MSIQTTHEVVIEYAPKERYYDGTRKREWSAGNIRVNAVSVSIHPGREIAPFMNSHEPPIFIKPGEIDGLISALIEARAIGRHMFGKEG